MKCCICKNKIEKEPLSGWDKGHNPWPIKDKGSCCGVCNMDVVVPARLMMHLGINSEEAQEISRDGAGK